MRTKSLHELNFLSEMLEDMDVFNVCLHPSDQLGLLLHLKHRQHKNYS